MDREIWQAARPRVLNQGYGYWTGYRPNSLLTGQKFNQVAQVLFREQLTYALGHRRERFLARLNIGLLDRYQARFWCVDYQLRRVFRLEHAGKNITRFVDHHDAVEPLRDLFVWQN